MIDRNVRGIDVSVYQGNIEWKKAAAPADGIRFAMLKATQGRSKTRPKLYLFRDSTFCANVRNASDAGVALGAYHYLTATTTDEAIREANYFISVIKPYKDKLPLGAAVDIEDNFLPLDKALLTAIVHAFCRVIKEAGFTPMIYTNPDFLRHRLGDVSEYGLWLALWRDRNLLPSESAYPNLRIWQWGRETVDGIATPCDADFGADDLLPSIGKQPHYAAEVCRLAGLSAVTRKYLEAYQWSGDLFRKLYLAIKGKGSV